MSVPQAPSPTAPRPGLFGPILGWELTVLARRSRYFLIRAGYAIVLGLVMWMTYTISFQTNIFHQSILQQSASFATGFYFAFVTAQLFVALLLTPAFVATALPQEKERKTIEYLFVSDLRNREIVLGKMLARVMNLLMILLVGVPVVALAGLFGGINYAALLTNTLATVMVMLSVAGLSMVVSIYRSTTRQSLFSTYGILFFISFVLPFLVMLGIKGGIDLLSLFFPGIERWLTNPNGWLDDALTLLGLAHPASPLFLSQAGLGGIWGLPLSLPLVSVIHALIHGVLAASFMSWATIRLRSAYRTEPHTTGPIARQRREWSKRISLPRPPVWQSAPFVWKETHQTRFRRFGFVLLLCFAAGSIYYYGFILDEWWKLASAAGNRDYGDLARVTSFASIAWIAAGYLVIAFRAASSISEEKDRDCWISLLATPVTARELVFSKILGSFLAIVPYLLIQTPAVLACSFLIPFGVIRLVFWLLTVCCYGWLIASIGVQQSMVQKNSGRAIGVTLFITALVCGLMHLFLTPVLFMNGDIYKIIGGSLPWVPIVGAFTFSLSDRGSDGTMEMIVVSIIFMVIYSIVSLTIYSWLVNRFPRFSERIEGD
jgi:ABC-type transport system involved in multi-copper enzyme maturation permease subunit